MNKQHIFWLKMYNNHMGTDDLKEIVVRIYKIKKILRILLTYCYKSININA